MIFLVNVTNRNLLRIWSHLLKKSLMKNFIFCAVTSLRLVQIFLIFSIAEKFEFATTEDVASSLATTICNASRKDPAFSFSCYLIHSLLTHLDIAKIIPMT